MAGSLKLGSLFDGSGGFPLAGAINGIIPVWASEIEPYPIRVTKARFPNMKHLGSVLDVKGDVIEPVDIITFGSPCQDLSVAGKQLGIHAGERSNLFFEAVRIIKEMRNATSGKYPRFAVWENVPGAFSSNKGADFQSVLQAFCEIRGGRNHIIPQPPKGKWGHAGCVVGNGYSVAWRLYDAQYWGVLQRRKRIYLIADFASERAGEILFERESLCGYPAESGEAWEGTADHAEGGVGGSGGAVGFDLYNFAVSGDKAVTLTASCGTSANHSGPTVCQAAGFKAGQSKAGGIGWQEGRAATLSAQCSGTEPTVCYAVEGNTIDRQSSKNGKGYCESVSPTLNTQDRHGVCYGIDQQGGKGSANYAENVMPTLCSDSHGTPHGVCYAPNGNHCGNYEEANVSATLQTRYHYGSGGDAATVVYDCRGNGDGLRVPTLTGDHQNRVTDYSAAVVHPQVTGALCANSHPGSYTGQDAFNDMLPVVPADKPNRKYIVRRLTPLECCRLQGFPDWWEQGVEGSDSARYKMWGNGIALPCAQDVLRRITKYLKTE